MSKSKRITVADALAIIRNQSYANGALWDLTTEEERSEIEFALQEIEKHGVGDALIEHAINLISRALDRIKRRGA